MLALILPSAMSVSKIKDDSGLIFFKFAHRLHVSFRAWSITRATLTTTTKLKRRTQNRTWALPSQRKPATPKSRKLRTFRRRNTKPRRRRKMPKLRRAKRRKFLLSKIRKILSKPRPKKMPKPRWPSGKEPSSKISGSWDGVSKRWLGQISVPPNSWTFWTAAVFNCCAKIEWIFERTRKIPDAEIFLSWRNKK